MPPKRVFPFAQHIVRFRGVEIIPLRTLILREKGDLAEGTVYSRWYDLDSPYDVDELLFVPKKPRAKNAPKQVFNGEVATILQIAAATGRSHATVSRVIKEHGHCLTWKHFEKKEGQKARTETKQPTPIKREKGWLEKREAQRTPAAPPPNADEYRQMLRAHYGL